MPDSPEFLDAVARAADAVVVAGAVVVTAGAGIGVDSGLPDFRGDEGFWNAYPRYARLGKSFVEMATPRALHSDPPFAWGFYGHRRAMYRHTDPHRGFEVLRTWVDRAPLGGFVVTSNVDGHFHRAGFDPDRVWEVHGTLRYDQCLGRCGAPPFPADDDDVEVDESTMRAVGDLPACPSCGGLARPNVLMFGDAGWDPRASDPQHARFTAFLDRVDGGRLVVVEVGAGTGLPTIRRIGEGLARSDRATLVRINPRETAAPRDAVAVGAGARDALLAIDEAVRSRSSASGPGGRAHPPVPRT